MKRNNVPTYYVYPYIAGLIIFTILLMTTAYVGMENDEGMWSYIGRIWIEYNMPPYIDAVENKTPGIFILHALSHFLFGINIWFTRGLGIISILISSFLLYLIGKRLYSSFVGLFSMFIFGFSMSWNLMDGAFTGHTENFMILFTILSIFFVLKAKERRENWSFFIALSGLMIGLAISFKQIALLSFFGVLGFVLLSFSRHFPLKKKVLSLSIFGIGLLVGLLICYFPLLLSGVSIMDYIKGAWLILFNTGSRNNMDNHIQQFFTIWGASRFVIFYPFIVLIAYYRNIKNHFFLCLILWCIFDFIGTNASGYYYGHQLKQSLPSLALLVAIVTEDVLKRFSIKKTNKAIILFFLCMLFYPYRETLAFLYRHKSAEININSKQAIGEWIKKHSDKKDYIYVIGYNFNPILSYSDRRSSSKYFNLIFVTKEDQINTLISDLKEKPPLYIVQFSNFRTILSKLMLSYDKTNNYKLIKEEYGYSIYRIKDRLNEKNLK
ncbi:ArnT family glycosyltransferase [Sinomicrobium sp. M5D2P17]